MVRRLSARPTAPAPGLCPANTVERVSRLLSRREVLAFRIRAQQLHRPEASATDAAVLDFGVQDSGPDGAGWALTTRGVDLEAPSRPDLVLVWAIRGAPHVYRRGDLPQVAAALEPFSDADAGKRIFDASKPLQAAGIANLRALDAVAAAMAGVVTAPMTKGEVSTALTGLLPAPYLRFCRPCNASHPFEMPFRLAALRAGLELLPGTSPPVLAPIAGFSRARRAEKRYDVIRGYLRFLGPATPSLVAGYLDAPVREVREHWPQDVIEVLVDGRKRSLLAEDAERIDGAAGEASGDSPTHGVRLLAPFDLFLQARDRDLLVADPVRAKALWPVLGRPGAVLVDGEVSGLWRPRAAGRRLRLAVDLWTRDTARLRARISEQAERLASYRKGQLSGVDVA